MRTLLWWLICHILYLDQTQPHIPGKTKVNLVCHWNIYQINIQITPAISKHDLIIQELRKADNSSMDNCKFEYKGVMAKEALQWQFVATHQAGENWNYPKETRLREKWRWTATLWGNPIPTSHTFPLSRTLRVLGWKADRRSHGGWGHRDVTDTSEMDCSKPGTISGGLMSGWSEEEVKKKKKPIQVN